MPPITTLVLGGAASGKSDFAEQLVLGAGKPPVYLATALAQDAEMRAKIDRHIARRGDGWTTIEAPQEADLALTGMGGGHICLLDCATMWLNNLMMVDAPLAESQARLLDAIRSCAADLVIVSNEVGQGIVPDNALARRFREAQGRLNIALAAQADTVVQVVAGLPIVLKGTLP